MSHPIPQGEILAEFFAPGTPCAQGSKSGFAYQKKETGKLGVALRECSTAAGAKRLKAWRKTCQTAAGVAFPGRLLDHAVHVDIVFLFPRPQSHYGTGRRAGQLKAWAAEEPMVTKPDREKLERAVFDALTGVVWVDDSRVVGGTPRKRYVMPGEVPGVHVRIRAACCCGLPKNLCPKHGLES